MAVLESKLVISAVDETKSAFDSIEAHIKSLSQTVGSVNRAIGGTGSTIASVGRNRALAARGTGPFGSFMGSIASTAAGVALAGVGGSIANATINIAKATINAASSRQSEEVAMRLSGETADEIKAANQASARLAEKAPNIDQNTLLALLREVRPITGSYEAAEKAMDKIVDLATLVQQHNPQADLREELEPLVKALEMKNVTQNPEEFQKYMDAVAKAINVFPSSTLKPYDYYEAFKYTRGALPTLSEDFLLHVGPTLMQEMGGEGFGAGIAAFNREIVGQIGKKGAFEEMARFGLIDKDALENMPGAGEGRGIKEGRTVKGVELAQRDPYEWIRQYVVPAFAAQGVTSPEAVNRELGLMFPNLRGNQMAQILAQQILAGNENRIEKDREMLRRASGLEGAEIARREDPLLAAMAAKNAPANLTGTVFGSPIKNAAENLANAAGAINRFNSWWESAKENRESWLDMASQAAGWIKSSSNSPFLNVPPPPAASPLIFRGASDWESRAGALTAPAGQTQPQGPQAVNVTGQATIDHTVHVDVHVDLDPALRATIEAAASRANEFTVPLWGGGSGRMDSDAGPHRVGGIGSM